MNKEQILNVFRGLARSQGYYGRLLQNIESDPEWGEEYLSDLEAQNFGSDLDLILYVEGG